MKIVSNIRNLLKKSVPSQSNITQLIEPQSNIRDRKKMTLIQETWRWINKRGNIKSGTLDEMDAAFQAKEFDEDAAVWLMRDNEASAPVIYGNIKRIPIIFDPTVESILAERASSGSTIYSGQNNSGKSLLLKFLFKESNSRAYFVPCNRFYHVNVLPTFNDFEAGKFHVEFVNRFYRQTENEEQNAFKLEQVLASLSDKQLDYLFDLCEEMLGNNFSIKSIREGYQFSGKYVAMDGNNLSFGSTGTRLLMTLLGICVNDSFETILIDEPELGLSPRIQATLARYFFNPELREKKFPHLKNIFIATHSHLFLDRSDFHNNFVVSKSGSVVEVSRIKSPNDFNHLQFQLLGNELESMFLPSAIVIVEGPSDHTFISKVVKTFIAEKSVSVVQTAGEGRTKEMLHSLKQVFGDIQRSPYQNRIFVVRDSKNSTSVSELIQRGVNPEHIITWSKNGIEFYYPLEIITQLFSCGTNYQLSEENFTDEMIKINGIEKKKTELAKLVADTISINSKLHLEVEQMLEKVRQVL